MSEEANKSEWRSDASRSDVGTAPETTRTRESRPAYGEPLSGEMPAAARHIRPDELLAALAAIEARKGEAVVGAVPLGEALAQTGARVTPDEVWQEVSAQRKLQGHSGTGKVSSLEAKQRRKRWWQAGAGIACVFATAVALRFLAGDIKTLEVAEASRQPTLPTAPPAPVPQNPVFGAIAQMTPRSVSLAELQPGTTLQLSMNDATTIERLRFGDQNVKPLTPQQLATIFVDPTQSWNLGDQWQMVVGADARIRFQVWVEIPRGTPTAELYTGRFPYYNRPDNPAAAGKVLRSLTLPLGAFQSYSGSGTGNFMRYEATLKEGTPLSWEPTRFVPPSPPPDAPVPLRGDYPGAPRVPPGTPLEIQTKERVSIGHNRYVVMERRQPGFVINRKDGFRTTTYSGGGTTTRTTGGSAQYLMPPRKK